jgi:DNA-binding HxlR family transcriptional regulator
VVKKNVIFLPMGKPVRTVEQLCPSVEAAFNLLGRKWAGLIIRELSAGPRHFCDLERGIPAVSARVLTERMKELEEAGILTRTVDTGTPVRVIYALTDKGKALIPVMDGLEKWARSWNGASEGSRGHA